MLSTICISLHIETCETSLCVHSKLHRWTLLSAQINLINPESHPPCKAVTLNHRRTRLSFFFFLRSFLACTHALKAFLRRHLHASPPPRPSSVESLRLSVPKPAATGHVILRGVASSTAGLHSLLPSTRQHSASSAAAQPRPAMVPLLLQNPAAASTCIPATLLPLLSASLAVLL